METWTDEPRHRFTVDEVYAMERAGLLEDERVELIEGELLLMSPNHPPRAFTVTALTDVLSRTYRGAAIRVQLPLSIATHSEPEPDLVVARAPATTYGGRHPRGPDCILVVEVSWTSRRRDVGKARLYAAAGVPVYWLLDVEARRLDLYELPRVDGTYASLRSLEEHEEVTLPETQVTWRVAELLPPGAP
jgi:Uma2 family endonuclease